MEDDGDYTGEGEGDPYFLWGEVATCGEGSGGEDWVETVEGDVGELEDEVGGEEEDGVVVEDFFGCEVGFVARV